MQVHVFKMLQSLKDSESCVFENCVFENCAIVSYSCVHVRVIYNESCVFENCAIVSYSWTPEPTLINNITWNIVYHESCVCKCHKSWELCVWEMCLCKSCPGVYTRKANKRFFYVFKHNVGSFLALCVPVEFANPCAQQWQMALEALGHGPLISFNKSMTLRRGLSRRRC